MSRALDLPPGPDALVVIRVSPSFEPDRTLSLFRRRDGSFFLRTTRLTENVWTGMMKEMGAQQGRVISLDDTFQAAALSRVATKKAIRERRIDARTTHLLIQLWRALVERAQVVEEIGIYTAKFDGTLYRIWYGGEAVTTHSPASASVLGQAVSGAEGLYQLVETGSNDEQQALLVIRSDMKEALDRTLRNESCLRPYSEEDD